MRESFPASSDNDEESHFGFDYLITIWTYCPWAAYMSPAWSFRGEEPPASSLRQEVCVGGQPTTH